MKYFKYYKEAFSKYAEFKGRSSRSEFWYFVLFNFLILLGFSFLGKVIDDSLSIVGSIYSLAVIIPSIAVAVRRLHDTNRTGLWVLVNLIPLVGFFILLYLNVQPSDPKENKYGAVPKALLNKTF